jgi:MFS family permease
VEIPAQLEIIDRPGRVATLIAAGTISIAGFLVLPSIVIGMLADLGFSQAQIGRVSTCQLFGIGVGALVTLWMTPRFGWRRIAIVGFGTLLAADLASMMVESYAAFSLARFFAGAAAGIGVSFAAYALGHTRDSDRNFGWYVTCQVAFSIVGALVLPAVVERVGIDGVLVVLCALEIGALLLLVPLIPQARVSRSGGPTGRNDPRIWAYCVAVLAGVVCYFTAIGGFWTYIAPIGIDGGLSKEATGTALSIGLIGGLAGAYLAATVNIRYGRALPIGAALGAQFAGLGILAAGLSFASFVAASFLFCFGWYMLFPYQLGLLTALDRDGRSVVLANVMASVGSAFGPFLVAMFLGSGFAAAYWVCSVGLLLTLVITMSVVVATRERLKAAVSA